MAKKRIQVPLLTLFAVLTGCGSSASSGVTTGDAGGADGGGAQDDGALGDAPTPGDATGLRDSNTGCPPSEPHIGGPCSTTGLCVYGVNICCGGGFQCTGGAWQPVYAGCACIAPETDAAIDGSGDSGTDAAASDGGACPSSCRIDSDCNSCPQPSFGGWSCSGGACRFMG